MAKQYVIVNEDGHFWNGRKFVAEYPDAEIFGKFNAALKTSRVAADEFDWPVYIIEDYGLDTQAEAFKRYPTGTR